MSKTINYILIIIFIILLCVGGYLVYKKYFYEIKKEEAIKNNLFIRTIDNRTRKQISTNISIIGYSFNTSIKTLEEGRIKVEIPNNSTIYLINKNINNQNYGISVYKGKPFTIKNDLDIEFFLYNYGNLTIKQRGYLDDKEEIKFILDRQGLVNDFLVCIKWSINILNVNFNDLIKQDIPKRLENKVDKCYGIIDENYDRLYLTFSYFGNIDNNDYITLYFVDFEKDPNNPFDKNKLLEDSQNNDIGMKDIIFKVQ